MKLLSHSFSLSVSFFFIMSMTTTLASAPLVTADAPQLAAAPQQAVTLNLPGGKFPPRGTLVLDFSVAETILASAARGAKGWEPEVPLISSPLFDSSLKSVPRIVALQMTLKRQPPEKPYNENFSRIMLGRIKGEKPYQIAWVWDAPAHRFDVYLNGTLQEVIGPITIPYWEDGLPDLTGQLTVGGPGKDDAKAKLKLTGLELFDQTLSSEALAQMAKNDQLPPLEGEGRTVLEGPLEITSEGKKLLYAADFSQPLDVVNETELFEGDKRVRQPEAEWVLEANGTAQTEDGKLRLETGNFTPPSRWENGKPVWEMPGHVVLWLNQRMPDDILVEYEMEPYDSKRGLHILFFGARAAADGGSIFQDGMPAREGDFRNYIFKEDEYNSYHISFWAAPMDIVRRTANLRKNNGFFLLAAGDDRIVEQGPGPHKIRVLKSGGRIAAEVNGVKVFDYLDDGKSHGPVFTDGYLGLRMMGDSKWLKISDFKVYSLEEEK